MKQFTLLHDTSLCITFLIYTHHFTSRYFTYTHMKLKNHSARHLIIIDNTHLIKLSTSLHDTSLCITSLIYTHHFTSRYFTYTHMKLKNHSARHLIIIDNTHLIKLSTSLHDTSLCITSLIYTHHFTSRYFTYAHMKLKKP